MFYPYPKIYIYRSSDPIFYFFLEIDAYFFIQKKKIIRKSENNNNNK